MHGLCRVREDPQVFVLFQHSTGDIEVGPDVPELQLVELPTVFNADCRRRLGVVQYVRFKDDILLVQQGTAQQRAEIITEMRVS